MNHTTKEERMTCICIDPDMHAEPCHRKPRPHRRRCSVCIDYCRNQKDLKV
jgi:hypothetical protein